MFKPTRRASGKLMVTVRVPHHLTAEEAAAVLSQDPRFSLDVEDGRAERWPRSAVEAAIRRGLTFDGSVVKWDVDDGPDLDAARSVIQRHWPGWFEGGDDDAQ